MATTFGDRLKLLRESAGLSGNALARKSGVNATQIGRLERDERAPLLATAAKLADALGCTLDHLAGRENKSEKSGVAS